MSDTQQGSTYAALRQWVTVGCFLPGERLKIREVAQALGIGTMPVRAALLRLSKAQFDDVLQNRLLLEGEAAERRVCQKSNGPASAMKMGKAL